MLSLKVFPNLKLETLPQVLIDADLQLISADCFELVFKWQDKANEIIFSNSPVAGRYHELWQHTCFEAFVMPVTSANNKNYFEINLNTQKAWNVYQFEDYRSPQPPIECANAEVVDFQFKENLLRAKVKFNKMEFKKLKVSLCAVLNVKEVGNTYWSFKHADTKPNFHHFDSFVIERNF